MSTRALRIWHVGAKADPQTVNGANQSAWALARVQATRGHEVTMVMADEAPIFSSVEIPAPVDAREPATRTVDGVRIRVITLREALRLVGRDQVDVIHMHSVYSPGQAVLAARAKSKSVPYVITPHGGYLPQILARHNASKRLYRSTVERWRVRAAAASVAVAHGEVDDIRRMARRSSVPCEVIPNIVDAIEPRSEQHAARRSSFDHEVVYLGRLEVLWKGIDQIVAIAKLLPHRRFELYGVAHSSMDEIVLPPNVTVHEPVYGADKERVLGSARVLLQLSRWEVFGVSIVEALLLGAQVMVTDVMYLSSWVRETGGLVVQSLDAEQAARTLEDFLASPHDEEAASARASAAAELVDPASNAVKHEDLYARILAAGRPARVSG